MELYAIKNHYEDSTKILSKGNKYLVYSDVDVSNTKIVVILCDDNSFRGLSRDLFLDETEKKQKDCNI